MLGEMVGHLPEGLGGGYAYAYRYPGPFLYADGQLPAKRDLLFGRYALEIEEGFVYRVNLDVRDGGAEYVHDPSREIAVEGIIG